MLKKERTLEAIGIGIILGVIRSLVALPPVSWKFDHLPSFTWAIIWAVLIVLITLFFLRTTRTGTILGIVTFVTYFLLTSYLEYMIFGFSSSVYVILMFLLCSPYVWLNALLFVLAGFFGGFLGSGKIPISTKAPSSTLTETERRILDYLTKHEYKIRLSECANELGLNVKEVEATIKSLEEKGLLKRKG